MSVYCVEWHCFRGAALTLSMAWAMHTLLGLCSFEVGFCHLPLKVLSSIKNIILNTELRNKLIYLWSITLWQRRKEKSLSSKWYWKRCTASHESMKLEHTFAQKINSKWLKELNTRHGTIKLLEENMSFSDINHTKFLRSISQSNRNKSKNKQMGLHQTYKLLYSKGNHKQNKKTTKNGRKYLQMMQLARA